MPQIEHRLASLRKMAVLCAVLVLLITSLSAFIRLTRAGLGCEPWPQCYGQSARQVQQSAAPPASAWVAAVRITHRVTAVAALLLIIVMLMATLSKSPMLWREGRMVLGLLALALFLAVLGRWTADARVPAVVLGNLLGGFAMFALSCGLARRAPATSVPSREDRALRRWAVLGVMVLVLQLILGGLVSAAHASLSCGGLASCDLSGASWQLLNPWHEPLFDQGDPINRAGALVHWLHRAGALLLVAVLLPLGVLAWRRGRAAGWMLILLLVLQVMLGAALVLAGAPLAVALAHNMVAALLLAVALSMCT